MMEFLRTWWERLADERGEIRGLFLKIGLAAILVGLALTQVGPILANKIEINGIADNAADMGVAKYRQTKGDMKEVRLAVERALADREARLVGEVAAYADDNGDLVLSFTARKIARTWLFYHVGYLAPYTETMTSAKQRIYE